MDSLLRPVMRSADRLKIFLNGKKPSAPHAPYTRDMTHIMSNRFLEDPELFYFRPAPASDVRVLSERRLRGRSLAEIAFTSPIQTRWPENNT